MKDKTFITQGFGNVGYHASKFISEDNDMKLIGIAEYNGAIYNPDGLNVEHAKKFFTKHGSFEKYTKGSFIKDASLILKKECDVLIPAARENVITEKNAMKLKQN
jgi:glutamate dehydrogenase (NAD(P)+)